MAHRVITRFRLGAASDWPALHAEIAALAETEDGERGPQAVELLRTDETSAVLLLRFGDGDAGVGPWLGLAERLRPVLAEDPSTMRGDPAFELVRDEDSDTGMGGLEGPERVHAFVRSVAASGALWGLYGETWARSSAGGEGEALPCWPDAAAAARCVRGEWAELAPRKIDLEAYVDQWLTGMAEDGIVAVVFPTPRHPGIVVEPDRLAAAIRAQLAAAD